MADILDPLQILNLMIFIFQLNTMEGLGFHRVKRKSTLQLRHGQMHSIKNCVILKLLKLKQFLVCTDILSDAVQDTYGVAGVISNSYGESVIVGHTATFTNNHGEKGQMLNFSVVGGTEAMVATLIDETKVTQIREGRSLTLGIIFW